MKARILFHGVAVVALVATVVAAAQTPSTPKKTADAAAQNQSSDRQYSAPSVSEREASSGMATGKRQHNPISISGRESSAPSVSEREVGSGMATGRKSGSVIVLDREAQSGMATGKRQHQPILTAAEESRDSAHATESLSAEQTIGKTRGTMQNVQSNPMYKGDTKEGNNPLYEPKDKQAAPSGTSHETVEYKDGEDGTSHTRPGNHKTGSVQSTSGTTTPKQ